MRKIISLISFLAISFSGCKVYKSQNFDYPRNIDTSTKEIEVQEKKVYAFTELDVYADNQFEGARLNNFTNTNDTSFTALITPENEPINQSPWYAFKLWSNETKNISITLDYQDYQHRYIPKLSDDRINWKHLSREDIILNEDSTEATFSIQITKDTLWVSGQELNTSSDINSWVNTLEKQSYLTASSAGKSKLGREIPVVHFVKGEAKGKKLLVLLSRQHPPEVSGYLALKAFVNRIIRWDDLSNNFLDEYNILMFPLLNPDGVDMGHWRHSAGGVDTNRDWGYYRQPEIKQVTEYIIKFVNENKNKVKFALDFHSTQEDIYYTMDSTLKTKIYGFNDKWLAAIDKSIDGYTPNEEASGLEIPISKTWFFKQFKAESVTFEFGDETDRAFIKKKGAVAAEEMMKILLNDY